MSLLKSIEGFCGYFVNDCGDVFYTNQSGSVVEMTKQINRDGYYVVNLTSCGTSYHKRVNRLVAEAFLEKDVGFYDIVNHLDHDRKNNNVNNLEWTTCAGNSQHMVSSGRSASGECNSQARLKDSDVLFIYNKLLSGESPTCLSSKFGVDVTVIYKIRNRVAWSGVTKHLPDYNSTRKSKRGDFTYSELEEIYLLRCSGETLQKIGNKFNTSKTVISNFLKGKSYKDKLKDITEKFRDYDLGQ